MFSECPPKKRPYILKTLTPPEFQKWQKLALIIYFFPQETHVEEGGFARPPPTE